MAGTIEFDAEGRIVLIRGEWYRDVGGGKPVLTPWVGRCGAYREFGGFRVPTRVEVAWVVDGVEFAYARFDVASIECGDRPGPGTSVSGTLALRCFRKQRARVRRTLCPGRPQ